MSQRKWLWVSFSLLIVIAILVLGRLQLSAVRAAAPSSIPLDRPYLVKDIATGVVGSNIASPINFNGMLYFAANNTSAGLELWRSDGTGTGTVLVKDISPGALSSEPANFLVVGSLMYFSASDNTYGRELWVTDGTTAGTQRVKEICPGTCNGLALTAKLVAIGNIVYFPADDGTAGVEWWRSDGTSSGTFLVKDVCPGTCSSSPSELAVMADRVYFAADDGTSGREPWSSNGSLAGTARVADLYPGSTGSNPTGLTRYGISTPAIYFSADNGTVGQELFRATGASSCSLYADLNAGAASSNPGNFLATATISPYTVNLYFAATTATGGRELYAIKSETGAALVKDIYPGNGSATPANLTAGQNGRVYFAATNGTAGVELWRSDGTAATTLMVADIIPGSGSSSPTALAYQPARYEDTIGMLFFAAGTVNRELWATDGLTTTRQVGEISPYSANPTLLTVVSDTVFLAANDSTTGNELWGLAVFPDLALTQDLYVSHNPLEPGSPYSYTLNFKNNGWMIAHNIDIIDEIPLSQVMSVTWASAGADVTLEWAMPNNYTWSVEDLSPQEGGVITVTAWLKTGLPGGDGITNHAQIVAYNGTPDGDLANNQATTLLTVAEMPPHAVADMLETDEDTSLAFDPRLNDWDLNNDVLQVTALGSLAHGQAATDGALIWYTPTLNYYGSEVFSYTVSDNHGSPTSSAWITLTIHPINDPPVAVNDAVETPEDTTLLIDVLANDIDVDFDPLTVLIFNHHTLRGGGLRLVGGQIEYTPPHNYFGQDVFSYVASDGQYIDMALVQIAVLPVNDLPVAHDDQASTLEDTPVGINATANDTDEDGDLLIVSAVATPTHGTVIFAGGWVTYTPELDFNGQEAFTYTVGDGQGGFATALISLTVTAVNDPPVAEAGTDQTTAESQVVTFLGQVADVDGPSLTIRWTFGDSSGVVITNTLEPTHSYLDDGVYQVALVADDGAGAVVTDTLLMTVTNVAPQILTDIADQSVAFGQPITFTAAITDASPLDIFTATADWGDGAIESVTVVSYTVTGGHAYHHGGAHLVTLTVTDDDGGIATQTYTVTVSNLEIYIPLVVRVHPLGMDESEPNNTFGDADPVTAYPVQVAGTHDGVAGTGDVFRLESLTAGQVVRISLYTTNENGVQVVLYNSAGAEIARDFTPPYEISFVVTASGTWYYVYIFTPASAANSAAYYLSLQTTAGSAQAPVLPPPEPMDAARLDEAPQILP